MSVRDAYKVLRIEPLDLETFQRMTALEHAAFIRRMQKDIQLSFYYNMPWPPDWDKVYERTDV